MTWCCIRCFARDLCEENSIGGEVQHGVTSGVCNTSPPQGVHEYMSYFLDGHLFRRHLYLRPPGRAQLRSRPIFRSAAWTSVGTLISCYFLIVFAVWFLADLFACFMPWGYLLFYVFCRSACVCPRRKPRKRVEGVSRCILYDLVFSGSAI